MHPAERARGGEDDDVASVEVVHRLGVAIEADVAAVFRYVHAILAAALEGAKAVFHFGGGDVCHGDQLGAGDVLWYGQGV